MPAYQLFGSVFSDLISFLGSPPPFPPPWHFLPAPADCYGAVVDAERALAELTVKH